MDKHLLHELVEKVFLFWVRCNPAAGDPLPAGNPLCRAFRPVRDDSFNWTSRFVSLGRHATLQSDGLQDYNWMMTPEAALYPRHIEPRLAETLADTPVVLIHGPRQCGKTTLARMVGDEAGCARNGKDQRARCAAEAASDFRRDKPHVSRTFRSLPRLFS